MTVSMRNGPLMKALVCERDDAFAGGFWPNYRKPVIRKSAILKLSAQANNNLRTAPLVSEGGVSPPPGSAIIKNLHSGFKDFQAGS